MEMILPIISFTSLSMLAYRITPHISVSAISKNKYKSELQVCFACRFMQQLLVCSERFAHEPLQFVSLNGKRNIPSRNGKSGTDGRRILFSFFLFDIALERRAMDGLSIFQNVGEYGITTKDF
jgi:hypothetical protein